ncbi:MAG TPA: hypothetical protein VGD38_16695, partial [Pyrinomonadaceae bacterium]
MMSYQPRFRSAIWTTLVLLVSVPTSALAAPNVAVARTVEQNPTQQQTVAAVPAPTPPASLARGLDKQSDQGRQYGQPGFVGEPINLNVVNADVRDILNYITEQYGVNFVIDASVTAVPVTV